MKLYILTCIDFILRSGSLTGSLIKFCLKTYLLKSLNAHDPTADSIGVDAGAAARRATKLSSALE